MATTERLLTAEELMSLPDNGMQQELVRGRLIEMPPPNFLHCKLVAVLCRILGIFVSQHHLGTVVGGPGFILQRDPDTVRAPDVAFVSTAREALITEPEQYQEFAPDLAVEIFSPGDRRGDLDEKIKHWRTAGARLIWMVFPRWRTVEVHCADGASETISEDGLLQGEDVLPGFSCAVRDLFA